MQYSFVRGAPSQPPLFTWESLLYLILELPPLRPSDSSSDSVVLGHLSMVLAFLGHLDQASRQGEAALEEARRLSHAPTLAIALTHAWLTGWLVRLEPRSLLRVADEHLALAIEHGLEHFRMWALIQRGWCLAGLGRADDGIPLVAAGL